MIMRHIRIYIRPKVGRLGAQAMEINSADLAAPITRPSVLIIRCALLPTPASRMIVSIAQTQRDKSDNKLIWLIRLQNQWMMECRSIRRRCQTVPNTTITSISMIRVANGRINSHRRMRVSICNLNLPETIKNTVRAVNLLLDLRLKEEHNRIRSPCTGKKHPHQFEGRVCKRRNPTKNWIWAVRVERSLRHRWMAILVCHFINRLDPEMTHHWVRRDIFQINILRNTQTGQMRLLICYQQSKRQNRIIWNKMNQGVDLMIIFKINTFSNLKLNWMKAKPKLECTLMKPIEASSATVNHRLNQYFPTSQPRTTQWPDPQNMPLQWKILTMNC